MSRSYPRDLNPLGIAISSPPLILQMHGFGLIPELLLSVLDHLGRGNQAIMARVCQSFWRTAVTRIWEELPFNSRNSHLKCLLVDMTPNELEAMSLTPQQPENPLVC